MLFLGADCVHAHLQCLSCLNVKLWFGWCLRMVFMYKTCLCIFFVASLYGIHVCLLTEWCFWSFYQNVFIII